MSKNIVVTGANRGLGLSITQIHLAKGDQVVVIIRNSSEALKALAGQYESLTLIQGEVSDTESVHQAAEQIKKNFDNIDILYNNAALKYKNDKVPLSETNLDNINDVLNVNSVGPLRVIKYLLPLLKTGSVIINISSEAGSITQCLRESEFGYCMSKTALNMATMILKNAYKDDGLKFLAVHPGWLKTDMGGEKALNDPATNAEKIVKLAATANMLDENQIYIDFDGRPIPW